MSVFIAPTWEKTLDDRWGSEGLSSGAAALVESPKREDSAEWTPKAFPDTSRTRNRKRRFAAESILRGHRPTASGERGRSYAVCICGKFSRNDRASGDISVEVTVAGKTTVRGAQYCGSTWTCADCATHIGVTRGAFVERAITKLREEGYRCVMTTMTVPHQLEESCGVVFDRLKAAHAKLDAHGSYRDLLKSLRYVGRVRVVEITHGDNGWHVHSHEIQAFHGTGEDTTAEEDKAFAKTFQSDAFPTWDRIIRNLTGKAASLKHGFTAVPVWSANDYVAKLPEHARKRDEENAQRKAERKPTKDRWGASAEITKAHVKKAEGDGKTPWDILDDAHYGDAAARELFLDYAKSTWNRTQFETTKVLRELLSGWGIELGSDAEIVRSDPDYIFSDEAQEEEREGGHDAVVLDRVFIDRDTQAAAHRAQPLWLARIRLDMETEKTLLLPDSFREFGFKLELIKERSFVSGRVNPAWRPGMPEDQFMLPGEFTPAEWRATWPNVPDRREAAEINEPFYGDPALLPREADDECPF